MTTIACNLKGCAADTLMDDAGLKGYTDKLFRVDKGIAGFAGNVSDGIKFINWLKHDNECELGDNFAGILLTENGIITYESDLIPIPHKQDFYAIGSGRTCAMTAMYLEKSPKQAIEIAGKLTIGTEGDIVEMTL